MASRASMASDEKNQTAKVFQNIQRDKYDQAMHHAVDGHPELMKMYQNGKRERGGLGETSMAGNQQFRSIEINGEPLSHPALELVEQIESDFGEPLPNGSYWYDSVSGAFGVKGNATWFFLPPNLPFGGQIDPLCSGPETGIVINGRDIHPLDLQTLNVNIGYIQPGFYVLDSHGNLGTEGQPAEANIGSLMGVV